MNQNKQIIFVIFLITFISSGCNFMDTLYETTPECSESNLYGCSVKGTYIELHFEYNGKIGNRSAKSIGFC